MVKWREYLSFVRSGGLSPKPPLVQRTLCVGPSRLVQITVSPRAIVSALGKKAKLRIVTFAVAARVSRGRSWMENRTTTGTAIQRTSERTAPSLDVVTAETARIPMSALRTALEARDVSLDAAAMDRFERFGALLRDWNERVNLTAITEPDEIATKHFLDSLTLLLARPLAASARVVDVGTGAGFPGIPLAIARTDARITLIESIGKKVRFLEEAVRVLSLKNARIVHGRAEELAHQREHRERYDVAVVRALPDLAVNLELLLPFCRLGGAAIAYKGRIDEELPAAQRAADALGGEIGAIVTTASLGLGELLPGRNLVLVAKRRRTPSRYPRAAAELGRRSW